MSYPQGPYGTPEEVQPGPPPWAGPGQPAAYAPYPPAGQAPYGPPQPGPYAPQPPQGTYPPPERKSGKRKLLLAVGAVAVVVVLVLALDLTGILPILPGSSHGTTSSGSTSALDLWGAENLANATASARGGGTWGLAYAESIQSTATFNPPAPSPPCSLGAFAPPAGSTLGTGSSYLWGFVYITTPVEPTVRFPHLLFIVVSNDSATVTSQVDPSVLGTCPGIEYPIDGALPTNVSDSPAIAADGQRLGGSTFLTQNPSALVATFLTANPAGETPFPAFWSAEYFGPCSAAGVEPGFAVVAWATNMTVRSHGWSNESCTPPSSVQQDLFSFSEGSHGASANAAIDFDNLTISVPSGLSLGVVILAILQSNLTLVEPGYPPNGCSPPATTSACGGAPQYGSWYALLVSGGSVVAAFPGQFSIWGWSTSTTLSSGETLELVSTTPLHGSGDTLIPFTWQDTNDISGSTTL